MVKKSFALALLLVLLLPHPGFAQPEPAYSLVYSTIDQVYVATLSGGQWQSTALPPGVRLGQFDIGLLTPQWGSDGQTLFTPLFDLSGDYPASNTIAVYDTLQGELVQQIQVFEQSPGFYDSLFIQSVSPDQHYLAVYQMIDFKPYLIDRQTGGLFPLDCYAAPLAWLDHSVLLSNLAYGDYGCDAGLSLVDLETGQVVNTYPAYDTGDDRYPTLTQAVLLSDGRVVLGEPAPSYSETPPVGLLDTNGTLSYWGVGDRLSVSNDENFAAYVDDSQMVIRVNLQTLATEQVGQARCISQLRWKDDTLIFWEGDESGALAQVQITGGERQAVEVYSGSPVESYSISPSLDMIAVLLPGKQFEVRQPNADPLPVPASPNQHWYLNNLTDVVTWSGDWLHLVDQNTSSTFSFHLTTGEWLPPPKPEAQLVSTSPDGRWWLYAIASEELVQTDQLFLFDPDTGETVVLLENVDLAQHNFHFFPWEYYIWSQ